jgi:outer membrane protein OmpA-like peptidoglycan-associated protein
MKRTTTLIAAAATVALSGCSMSRMVDRADVVTEPESCAANTFEVYFAEGEARLTEPARQAIGMTAARLQRCDIQRVVVRGLASASGSATANQTLSEQRAVAVAEALVAAGWPTPAFELGAEGAEGAVNSDGTREPMRRRTEVLVVAAPRA